MRFPRIPLIGATRFVASSCLALGSLSASSADLALPNAGSLLQDVKPLSESVVPARENTLRVLPTPGAETPESAPFEVKKFEVIGNTVFETATLRGLLAQQEGQRLTLAQIEKTIGAITQHYQQAGFPLARAIIPVQTIEAGVVTVQVIEGRLGAVSLENGSAVKTAVLNRALADLGPGMVIRQESVEDALVLLTDLPSVVATSVLRPGQKVGTADLAIVVQPGAIARGDATVDNYGSRYTGRERLTANVQLFNPLGLGDVLGLSALTSGSAMNYGRLSYEIPLDSRGGYFGAAASNLQYSLGNTAASLQAQGTAQSGSVWLRKYLVHHQGRSVGLRLQYDPSKLRDDIESTGNHNVRQLELLSLELQAQEDNNWLGGGYSNIDLGVRGGSLAFDDAVAKNSDALTAKTQGAFGVTSLRVEHLQRLDRLTSVMVAFNGQWAQGNLDASQKISLGGAHSVRAYESGVLSGDSGQFASLELQQNLAAAWNGNSRWQAVLFVDAGQVQINQKPWTSTNNQAYISGAGLGLNWQGSSNWHARLYAARALAPAPSQLDGAEEIHSNAWIEIGKMF